MHEALHGDGSTGPNPILQLEANLKQNRVFIHLDKLKLNDNRLFVDQLWTVSRRCCLFRLRHPPVNNKHFTFTTSIGGQIPNPSYRD